MQPVCPSSCTKRHDQHLVHRQHKAAADLLEKAADSREEVVVHHGTGVIVLRRDLLSLCHGEWLNDEILNMGLSLLQVCKT